MAKKSFAKNCLTITIVCLTALYCQAQQQFSCHHLKRADLLFHITFSANPITEVTSGNIDHVAIYLGGDSLIEAVERGVVITRLDSLRQREGQWLVGRVKKVSIEHSIDNALHYVGSPYDSFYLANNDAIYCSELVQLSFVNRKGHRLFTPIPMSFHNGDGHITPYWQDFYARHHMQVPEGQPGTNPSELSQRSNIRILGILTYETKTKTQ